MRLVQPIRDPEEVDKIKNILKMQSYRNYFLFMLGIHTGLRIGDMLKLQVKDVRNKTHIDIKEEKTGKFKKILLSDRIKEEIIEYILVKKDEDYLFPSRQGKKPITRMMAYNILNDAGKKIGLKEIGTHTLRKTFGYHFYQQNKDVALLMEIFNHSSPSITLKYIGINQDIMDSAIKNFNI